MTGYGDGTSGDAVIGKPRKPRFVKLLLGFGAIALLGTSAFVIGAVINNARRGSDACVLGVWALGTTLFDSDRSDPLVVGPGLRVVFRADGTGTESLNERAGNDETVYGLVTFRYTAKDGLIRYTDVKGYADLDYPDGRISAPVFSKSEQAYTCRGGTLTIRPTGIPPQTSL